MAWGWAWHALHSNTWRGEPCRGPWTHTSLMLCLWQQVQRWLLLLLWWLLVLLLHLLLHVLL